MRGRSLFALILFGVLSFGAARPAAAQFAVIDVASIAQLVQQYQTLQQQLANAQLQLTQAQQQYQSLTGPRGMQSLLGGINRNYLPGTWSAVPTALSAPIQATVSQNAVLTPQQVARLSLAEQQQLRAARSTTALLQVATQQAYATTSGRFATLQQLTDAIPSATDLKGIGELQARIQVEQAMLQNENTKLELLHEAAQAQQWSEHQRRQEQAIADIGSLRALPAMRLP